jgi:hypothetical protein
MRDRSGPLARVSFAYLVVLPVSGPDVPGRRTVAAPVFEAEVTLTALHTIRTMGKQALLAIPRRSETAGHQSP